MALIHCDFFSESLGMCTSICVILPETTKSQIGMEGVSYGTKHPVLYLLHGYSDDHTIWQRRTSIERYVASTGMAVVMPAVAKSFYNDMKNGDKYWTYVSKELPEKVQSFFPISDKREDNFVAGLSMGGFGAIKMALNCPDKFAAGASLSGALDLSRMLSRGDTKPGSELYNVFGDADKVPGTSNDLAAMAKKVAESDGPKPKLYIVCGTEDFLYEDNQNFLKDTKDLNLDITYKEGPGTHEWGFWDAEIQDILKWLPLNK